MKKIIYLSLLFISFNNFSFAQSGENYFNQGKSAEKKQDYKKASQLYEKACNAGNPPGCVDLGFLYYKGRGVNQDYQKAFQLFEKACNGGNAVGCSNLKALQNKSSQNSNVSETTVSEIPVRDLAYADSLNSKATLIGFVNNRDVKGFVARHKEYFDKVKKVNNFLSENYPASVAKKISEELTELFVKDTKRFFSEAELPTDYITVASVCGVLYIRETYPPERYGALKFMLRNDDIPDYESLTKYQQKRVDEGCKIRNNLNENIPKDFLVKDFLKKFK